jgi:3-oxoacyl-[acyl-carrier protein] reductase
LTLLLENQVAILTGAGRGIGAAAARLFAEHGASVVVSDRDEEPARAVAQEIESAGGKAIAVPGDVTDPEFPERLIAKTIETFGSLHILVNNAGYTWDGMLHKMTDRQWQAMLDVHNTAPFRLIRAAAPYMRDAAKKEFAEGLPRRPRCIVNVSSTSGLHGNPGQANYATAKLGIVGLTKTIAKEWGPLGIRCNAVAFGYIETRLTAPKENGETISVEGEEVQLGIPQMLKEGLSMFIPLGRGGTPEEAAAAILFLASPLASYVNGHTLEVPGGLGI